MTRKRFQTSQRQVSQKIKMFSYFSGLLAFFFVFALRGFGGAFKMRRSASSNGIGVRSGLDGFAFMLGV